jgi:SAM-dependent methyltransferase
MRRDRETRGWSAAGTISGESRFWRSLWENHDRPLAHSPSYGGRNGTVHLGLRPEGRFPACHDRRAMDDSPPPPPALPLADDGYPAAGGVARRPAGAEESARANRRWWDAAAPAYLAEHGSDLGDVDFLWCPEGLREADAHLLGDVAGRRVLEIGCGSAPCARWLRTAGADVVALDVSAGMLHRAAELNRTTGVGVPLVQADAGALPLLDGSMDVACSAFGGLPFVADVEAALREVARVLRPGGRFVASVNHPMRWPFPDSPDPEDLRIVASYFDRTPYVETDDAGRTVYVEHHRTVGDWVRAVVGAGLVLDDLLEPEWTPGRTQNWGQWSPERGALVPGTLIVVCHT